MRYERLELDLSTTACHELLAILNNDLSNADGKTQEVTYELTNLRNELHARIHRYDPDPKSLLNSLNDEAKEWLDL